MTTHYAGILTIGNELLNGDIVNTNASRLARLLRGIGVPCRSILTVTDEPSRIREALFQLWKDHDLTVVSGGLGPTHDDVTKTALLEFFDDTLIRNTVVLNHVTDYFRKRGRKISEVNRRQADVPSRAKVLFNELGTAPGLFFEQDGKFLVALPGVPYELDHIAEKRLVPELERRWQKEERRVQQHYFRTTGIGESDLSDRVLADMKHLIPPDVEFAFLPHPGGVDIRITEINGDKHGGFEDFVGWVEKTAGEFIFSEDYHQSLAGYIVSLLSEREMTVAFAESCTGGYLADELTGVPGSSNCFKGGLVAYDNQVKSDILGVSAAALNKYGAVSAPVALEMAANVAGMMNADMGISTTGIAGPGGGSPEKPVGTVWIGFWAGKNVHFACRYTFTGDRHINKERSFAAAMDILRRHVLGIPGLPHNPEVVTG